jgi:hypothetical protein
VFVNEVGDAPHDNAIDGLLAEILDGDDVDADLAPRILRETGGNPFLVVAVADAIRAGEDMEVTTPPPIGAPPHRSPPGASSSGGTPARQGWIGAW